MPARGLEGLAGLEKLLADLARSARSATDAHVLARQVCPGLVEALGLGAVGLAVLAGDTLTLAAYSTRASARARSKEDKVFCPWCRQPMFPLRQLLSPSVAPCHGLYPFLGRNQSIGYLFASAGSGSLDPSTSAFLSTVAVALGAVLERMELQTSSEQRLRRLEALHSIALAVASTLDPDAQVDLLLNRVMEELAADLAAIHFLDASGTQLVMAHQLGARHQPLWRDLKFRIGEGAAGWIAQHRTPLVIPDVNSDPRWVHPHPTYSEGIVSYLGVPLLAENQLAGVLDVATRTYRRFTEEEVKFLAATAAQAGSALLNTYLLGFLRRLVENAPDVIFRIGLRPKVMVEYVSPAVEALTGYQPQELYANPGLLTELLATNYLQDAKGWTEGAYVSGQPATIPVRHRDGRRIWIEVTTSPVLDRDGSIMAVEGIARDMTAQKAAEEEKERALEELERRLEQLQALYEIARHMTNPSDLGSLVRKALEHVRRLLQADYVVLYRAEQDIQGQNVLAIMAHTGLDPESLERFGLLEPGTPSAAVQAASSRRLVIVEDTCKFPYRPETKEALQRLGIRSLLGMPLVVEGELLGVLNVLYCKPMEMDADALGLLETLANLLATGLRSAHSLEDLTAQAQRLAALYQMATAINRHASISEIFNTALEEVVSIIGADRAGIALADPDGNSFTVVAEYGGGIESALGKKIPAHTPLERRLVRDRRPVAIPDLANCPELGTAAAVPLSLGIRAMLIVPIVIGETVIGTMGVDSMKPRQFMEADISMAQAIAHQVSVALERARLLDAEREKVAELEALYSLSQELSDIPYDSTAILEAVTRRAVTELPCTAALGLLVENDEVVFAAHHARRAIRWRPASGTRRAITAYPALLRASMAQEPYLLSRHEAGTLQERQELFPPTTRHLCIVPLRVSMRLLGFLLLGEARSPQREPFGPAKLKLARGMALQTASALARAQLFHRLEESYLQTVLALAKAVEAKDTYTSDHAQRIAELAVAVGREMGLTPQELEDLRYGAILHDIGKLAVPDAILRKAGPLDRQEWDIIRRHPAIGAEILSSVKRLEGAARIVRHHHERMDGRGYPDGLAGEAIPLGSRILSVVDSFIAMTDRRVYRAPKSVREALEELDRHAGLQFDPQVVAVFKRVLQRLLDVPERAFETLKMSFN